MVNNSAKVIATSALVAVGLLATISGASADDKYPQYNMITEGFPSTVDWESSQAVTPHVVEKVVFACVKQDDGTYSTVEKVVRETMDPDNYPVYSTEDLSAQYGLDGKPMMVWTATLASNHPKGIYAPENRCQYVSTRLSNLSYSFGLVTPEQVAKLGEASRNGKVNGQQVVFLSQPDASTARGQNMIFTLKPDNAKQPSTTLTQFQIGISAGTAAGIGGPDLPAGKLPPVIE
ncbi:conserved hypothetical protein [Rippkaea orientalis PCC 8801]|uniref:Circadian oscillating polypeptide COP23 n=1 Tax=Rippkaea orientalis (strain PCC 8801 / RF-1) TaxID=41431 RepID=Q54702_RIPO1|nr:COP23 domain-containing protein [Rippkaea orientalis]AAC44136.1 circadian oscillating polypeptide COP23 precursor [Rippkaea orientalis PCC 8801]ACK66668.1 conserved hypothetical protein [Rippkaea orientalis PCC 8801]